LKERIESILNQTWPHYEIIVLDDASTDNSREIIEQYRHHPKVKSILYNYTNSGLQTLQWIKGIGQATFDWVWIAESDDFAENNFLETASQKISEQGKSVVFYTDSYQINEQDKKGNYQKCSAVKGNYFETTYWQNNYTEDGKTEINRYMKYVCTINNVSCCIIPKKEALDVLHRFPHLIFYNDWLFYVLLLEQYNVVYSSACLNWYRLHTDSHFNTRGNELTKKKECFIILCHLYKASYITGKNKLVKFLTEQYLGFGLWKERRLILPLFSFFIRKSPVLFIKFLMHLLTIKITRKKIKYIF
jgi:glycosyltransferase involved in cell wall biosynthesis